VSYNRHIYTSIILLANLTIVISRLQVIPNLVQSLTQEVRARSIIVRSLSSIRDLSITIQKAEEIVKQTKGNNVLSRILKSQLRLPRISKGY
jgi:hypothetical protein